jgi:hypothetical protein
MYTLFFVKPGIWLIDHFNQPAILRGIKRRAEGVDMRQPISTA